MRRECRRNILIVPDEISPSQASENPLTLGPLRTCQSIHEPGPGDFPVALHSNEGHAERAGNFLFWKASEESQFDDARGAWIGAREF